MIKLKDIIFYFLVHYPYPDELSNARLTKLVYLADWHSAVVSGKTLTNINWYFDNYGPFVHDIKNTAEKNPDIIKIVYTSNIYGKEKALFKCKNNSYKPKLHKNIIKKLNKVINITKDKSWDEFIKFVYSTYPIISSDRYSTLDLVAKAKEYNENKCCDKG